MKKLVILVFLVLFCFVTIKGVDLLKNTSNEDNKMLALNTLEEKIMSLSELATIKYNYKNVLLYKDEMQLKGFSVPFTEKSFVIVYTGYVKAGVELDAIEIKIADDNSVTLIVPEARFLDNVINEEETVVYDEKSGVFNRLNMNDYFNVMEKEKSKIEVSLLRSGFLDEANERTKKLLISILSGMGYENINISFKEEILK